MALVVVCQLLIGLFVSLAGMIATQGIITFVAANAALERGDAGYRVRWRSRRPLRLEISIAVAALHAAFAGFAFTTVPLGLVCYLT